jgi:hypothetical protein
LTGAGRDPLDQRWRLLVPDQAVAVHPADPDRARTLLAEAPAGGRVAVVGGPRARRFARRHGIRAERIYLAVPNLEEPVVVAELAGASLSWFTGSVLTVPSGRARWHGLLWAAVRVARRWPMLLVHAPIGERIVIGVRR